MFKPRAPQTILQMFPSQYHCENQGLSGMGLKIAREFWNRGGWGGDKKKEQKGAPKLPRTPMRLLGLIWVSEEECAAHRYHGTLHFLNNPSETPLPPQNKNIVSYWTEDWRMTGLRLRIDSTGFRQTLSRETVQKLIFMISWKVA